MTRRRTLTEEERALFEATFRETVPLKRARRRSTPPEATTNSGKPPKPVATKRKSPGTGLDGNTAERLRRGEIEPEARLDLHGLTETAAHHALVTFLRAAVARKLRLVIVVTGKGARPPAAHEPFDLGLNAKKRGVLRQMTPRWLAQPELAQFVADIRESHRRHGGAGALYIYLRKG
ncbi:MAG TPA: Smr/MutS family protein [Rhizomicrobium sp.]